MWRKSKWGFIINWTYNHSWPIQSVDELGHTQWSYLLEQDLSNEETNKIVEPTVMIVEWSWWQLDAWFVSFDAILILWKTQFTIS